jgi:hypothetical protein
MSLVVEDGTGLVNAESYISVTDADAYHTNRGHTGWTGSTGTKEIALRKATEYIDSRWGGRFKGEKEFPDTPQALEFPRLCIEGYGGIPVCLQRATAEYALRALTAELAPDPVIDASGLSIVGSRKKVGPIETETTFASQGPGSSVQLLRPYPTADMLLRPVLLSSNSLVRA